MKEHSFDGIDYTFRPKSYWNISDVLQAILGNVQGTLRRQMIPDYWEAGAIGELEKGLLRDRLTAEDPAHNGCITIRLVRVCFRINNTTGGNPVIVEPIVQHTTRPSSH